MAHEQEVAKEQPVLSHGLQRRWGARAVAAAVASSCLVLVAKHNLAAPCRKVEVALEVALQVVPCPAALTVAAPVVP